MANKTVLIAVDNSQACLQAIEYALENFPKGYTYHLLHVQARPYIMLEDAGAGAFAYEVALERDLTAASEAFMKDHFIPRAAKKGAQVVAHVLHSDSDGSSNIGSAICQYADDTKPAALVLMRENKSAVSRFFLGSVTKYCAVHSPVPVVIVPAGDPVPDQPAAERPDAEPRDGSTTAEP